MKHSWHFDESQFSTTLMLQKGEQNSGKGAIEIKHDIKGRVIQSVKGTFSLF